MQYQWQSGLFTNGLQPREVELGFAAVFAMYVADGDSQCVNPGAGDKIGGLGRIGEFAAVTGTVEGAALIAADRAQLGFDRNAKCMTHFHYFCRLTDVLFILQAGTVKHHRGKAQADGFHDGIKTGAVIEIQHYRDVVQCRFGLDGSTNRLQRHIFKMDFGNIDDER